MHYACIVSVEFDDTVAFQAEDGAEFVQKGFTMVVGCNVEHIWRACELASQEAIAEAEEIRLGAKVDRIEVQRIDPEHWDDEIRRQIVDFEAAVYYKSSKIYYQG